MGQEQCKNKPQDMEMTANLRKNHRESQLTHQFSNSTCVIRSRECSRDIPKNHIASHSAWLIKTIGCIECGQCEANDWKYIQYKVKVIIITAKYGYSFRTLIIWSNLVFQVWLETWPNALYFLVVILQASGPTVIRQVLTYRWLKISSKNSALTKQENTHRRKMCCRII